MNFLERMKKTIARGYENATNLLNNAAEKTKEMGEKGILEYEIVRLEKEIENMLPLLGGEVYTLYRENKLKLMDDVLELKKILNRIHEKEIEITKKEKELEELKK
jgi:hypothetical protein